MNKYRVMEISTLKFSGEYIYKYRRLTMRKLSMKKDKSRFSSFLEISLFCLNYGYLKNPFQKRNHTGEGTLCMT